MADAPITGDHSRDIAIGYRRFRWRNGAGGSVFPPEPFELRDVAAERDDDQAYLRPAGQPPAAQDPADRGRADPPPSDLLREVVFARAAVLAVQPLQRDRPLRHVVSRSHDPARGLPDDGPPSQSPSWPRMPTEPPANARLISFHCSEPA